MSCQSAYRGGVSRRKTDARFVTGPHGRIAYEHIGPLTQESFQKKVLPVIERLRREGRAAAMAAPQAD
jgi:hypothetical protein